jgi:hypothetical protein
MTQEFINRLFAAMMGKHKHEYNYLYNGGPGRICKICGDVYWTQWSPSLDGESTKEVRDWFVKEMPEEWEKYQVDICVSLLSPNDKYFNTLCLNTILSITSLAQYIVDNYKEMFYEECSKCKGQKIEVDNRYTKGYREVNCIDCNGTGKIIIPRYAEVVRVIEEGKE